MAEQGTECLGCTTYCIKLDEEDNYCGDCRARLGMPEQQLELEDEA